MWAGIVSHVPPGSCPGTTSVLCCGARFKWAPATVAAYTLPVWPGRIMPPPQPGSIAAFCPHTLAAGALACRTCRCHFDAEQRSSFVGVAKGANVEAHCVVLQLPPAVCAQRITDRTNHPGQVEVGALASGPAAGYRLLPLLLIHLANEPRPAAVTRKSLPAHHCTARVQARGRWQGQGCWQIGWRHACTLWPLSPAPLHLPGATVLVYGCRASATPALRTAWPLK